MSLTGSCTYQYNPTELYQHRDWGAHCGKTTYAAYVEVVAPAKQADGSVKEVSSLVEREQADPYCPAHGGTADPSLPVVTDVAAPNRSDLPPEDGQ